MVRICNGRGDPDAPDGDQSRHTVKGPEIVVEAVQNRVCLQAVSLPDGRKSQEGRQNRDQRAA